MYGKHFASMYSGSMVGMGPLAFAVWGYVIANMVPDKTVGAQVELNPEILNTVIGKTTTKEIESVIQRFCSPDPKSRTPDLEGRKLVQLGHFDYQVVNGKMYQDIKDQEKRREQNRSAQERFRKNHPEKFKRGPKQNVSMAERNQMEADKRIAQQEDGSTDE